MLPSVPNINIRPLVSRTTITLSWGTKDNNLSSFTVICPQANYTNTVSQKIHQLTISSLSSGIDYQCSIRANNLFGSSAYVDFRNVQVGLLPSPVASIYANPNSMTSAEVIWTFVPGPGEGKTKWFVITAIDQLTNNETVQKVKSAHGYEVQRTIFQLKTNHVYVFKIQAINDVGYGPPIYSDPITININWVPTNLDKIQFWVDASVLDYEDNQSITQWADIANLSHLELAGSPPTLIQNGLNGLSIANFTPDQAYRISENLTNANQSFFAVVRQTGKTNKSVFTSYTSNQYIGYFNGQKQVIYLDALPNLRQNLTSDENWDLISLTLEQKSSSIFLWNGYPIKSSQITNPITSLTFNQGSDCQIAEVIFYNDTLIIEDRQVVEGYLAWKWGLQDNLPPTHPYKGTKPPITYTNKLPPKAPTNIIQVDGNQTSIEIIWTPPLHTLSYAFTLNNNVATPSKLLISTVVFNNLTIGTYYDFVITATNAFGSASARPVLTSTAPSHPHNLSTSAIAVKGFTAIWVGGACATSYQYLIDGKPIMPLDDQGVTNKKATFTNLSTNTLYNFNVIATNPWGSNKSNNFPVKTIGNIPSSLTFSSITTNSFDLYWSGAQKATDFYFSLDNGLTTITAPWSPNPWLSSVRGQASFTNLSPGQTYPGVIVYASSDDGIAPSQPPNPSVTLYPDPPSIPVFSNIGANTVTVSWLPVNNLTYTCKIGNIVYENVTSPFTIRSLTGNTPYTVTIIGTNSAGSAQNSASFLTIPEIPNLSIVPDTVTATTFQFTWTPVPGVTYSYTLTNNTNGNSPTPPTLITQLTANTQYTLSLNAINAQGPNQAQITLTTGPAAATNITASNILTNQFTLTWTAGVATTNYEIHYNTYTTNTSNTTATINQSVIPQTYYTVYLISQNINGATSSNTISVLTAPSTPDPYQVPNKANATSVQIVWTNKPNVTYSYTCSNNNTGNNITTPYTLTSLTPSNTFTFTLTATNATNFASNQISVSTAPPPVTLVATNSTINSFAVSWSGVTDAQSLILYYNTSTITVTGLNAYNVTGLRSNILFDVYVAAVNTYGESPSNVLQITTKPLIPGIPTGLTQTPDLTTDTTMQITWDYDDIPTLYTYSFSPGGPTGTTTGSPLDMTGLTGGTTYTLTLTPSNGPLIGPPKTLTVTTAPQATTISQASVTSNSITINISPSLGAVTYKVYYNTSNVSIAPTNSYTIQSLQPNTPYTIYVVSQNPQGNTKSNTLNITTPHITPPQPTNLQQTGASNSGVNISWSQSQPITGYIYTLDNGGPSNVTLSNPDTSISFSNLSQDSYYNFYLTPYNFNVSGPQSQIGVATNPAQPSLSQTAATYNSVTVSVSPFRSYYKYTFSCNGQNNIDFTGNPNPTVTFGNPVSNIGFSVNVTNGSFGSASASFNITSAPGILSISINSFDTSSITINISGYNNDNTNVIYYSGGSLTLSGRPGTQRITGLSPGTQYAIYVNSSNSYGNTNSNTINQTTAYEIPAAPNPSVVSVNFTSASFTWTTVSGISYTYSVGGQSGSATPGMTVNGLTSGIGYTFSLTATNGGGLTASGSCTFTTLIVGPPSWTFASNSYNSRGFSVDLVGNIYISAYDLNQIVKMDHITSNTTVIVSNNPNMGKPIGSVVVNNILYVCNDNSVSAVSLSDYSVTRIASEDVASFNYITTDGTNLFVTSTGRAGGQPGAVYKIDSNYNLSRIWYLGDLTGIVMNQNSSLIMGRVLPAQTLYMVSPYSGYFIESYVYGRAVGTYGFYNPQGMCMFDASHVYVAEPFFNRVLVTDVNTGTFRSIGPLNDLYGTWTNAYDVKFDATGTKIIILYNNSQYSVVDP